jgi:hypothetical protein
MSAPAEIARIDSELAQLRADLEAKERQIEEDAARIVRFLEEDFPGYLGREVKARFIGAPEFADAMRADTVAALRRELEEEGRRVGAEIAGALKDRTLWLVDVEEGAERALELKDLPAVWERVRAIDAALDRVLSRYQFPVEGARGGSVEYRPPSWFVSGTLLKTLLETLGSHAAERTRLRRSVERLETERWTRVLDLKWETAR